MELVRDMFYYKLGQLFISIYSGRLGHLQVIQKIQNSFLFPECDQASRNCNEYYIAIGNKKL
jgi:hypothetical protein